MLDTLITGGLVVVLILLVGLLMISLAARAIVNTPRKLRQPIPNLSSEVAFPDDAVSGHHAAYGPDSQEIVM